MVMGGQQDDTLEGFQTLVDGLDGFHVQMVGGLIQQDHVGTTEHHLGQHAADLLAAGEDIDLLEHVVVAEEHTAQEAAQIDVVLLGGVLAQPVHQLHGVALEVGGVVLGQVGADGGDAPLDGTFIGLQLAHQDLHQSGLGLLVLTDEGNLVVLANGEVDLVQQLLAVNGDGHILDGQDVLAQLALRAKADEGITAGGAGHFLDGQLVQQLAAGGSLLGLGLVGGEALDEQLQLFNLLLVALVLVADHGLDHLGGLVPEVIVTDVHLDLTVVDIHGVGADGVQEVAVVGNGDDHAGEVQQEVFQPVDGFDVQVVGGLVQHDDIGVAEEGGSQQDLDLQSGVHGLHDIIVHFGGDAQALENTGGVGLGFPAAHFREFGFQVGGAQAVLVGEVGLFVDGVLFLHDVIQVLVAHDDGVHDGVLVVGVLVLLQNGNTLFGVDMDGAVGGLQLAGEDAQEGGLAGTVGADDAVAVAGQELQVHVLEQPLAAKLHAEIVDSDHFKLLTCRTPLKTPPLRLGRIFGSNYAFRKSRNTQSIPKLPNLYLNPNRLPNPSKKSFQRMPVFRLFYDWVYCDRHITIQFNHITYSQIINGEFDIFGNKKNGHL